MITLNHTLSQARKDKGKGKYGGEVKPRLECFKYFAVRVEIPESLIHDSNSPASEAALDAAVAM